MNIDCIQFVATEFLEENFPSHFVRLVQLGHSYDVCTDRNHYEIWNGGGTAHEWLTQTQLLYTHE